MPCFVVILALITPRLVAIGLWFFTTWFSRLFDNLLWPILGLIFLPTTLIWYGVVQHWFAGEWTLWPMVGLVVALMIDVSPSGGRRRRD